MSSFCDLGDGIRIEVQFSQDGTPVDPSSVTLSLRDPNGQQTDFVFDTDPLILKVDTGRYRRDVFPTLSGQHFYRWVSTGTGAAAEEGYFFVRPTAFTPVTPV